MKITTRKYKCFNDSPKDEQEKIMLEVYYKLKNRSFARILYCASLFLILDSLVITLLISTFFKTEPSLAISIIPVFLVTFYHVQREDHFLAVGRWWMNLCFFVKKSKTNLHKMANNL